MVNSTMNITATIATAILFTKYWLYMSPFLSVIPTLPAVQPGGFSNSEILVNPSTIQLVPGSTLARFSRLFKRTYQRIHRLPSFKGSQIGFGAHNARLVDDKGP